MIPLALTLVFAAFVIRTTLPDWYRSERDSVERCFGHADTVYPREPRRAVPGRDTLRFPNHRITIYR